MSTSAWVPEPIWQPNLSIWGQTLVYLGTDPDRGDLAAWSVYFGEIWGQTLTEVTYVEHVYFRMGA
jgi:hypothetical protein